MNIFLFPFRFSFVQILLPAGYILLVYERDLSFFIMTSWRCFFLGMYIFFPQPFFVLLLTSSSNSLHFVQFHLIMSVYFCAFLLGDGYSTLHWMGFSFFHLFFSPYSHSSSFFFLLVQGNHGVIGYIFHVMSTLLFYRISSSLLYKRKSHPHP